MNSIADMGGMHGFGPIKFEENEPVFHADWERRMFGMFILAFAGGHFNVDMFRVGMEEMDPVSYLSTDYYEHWLHSLTRWIDANGSVTEAEIQARMKEIKEKEAA